jgi:hypothetical protein
MKNIEFSTLGFEGLQVSLPSSASELDQLAKREGAAIDFANSYFLAHIHLTKARKAAVAAIEKKSGVAGEKSEDGKKFTESEGAYIKRVEAIVGEGFIAEYQDVVAAAVAGVEVSFEKAAREVSISSSVPAKKYLEAADLVKGAGKVEKYLAVYAPSVDIDDVLDGNSWTADGQAILANVIKGVNLEAERKAREESANALKALIGGI